MYFVYLLFTFVVFCQAKKAKPDYYGAVNTCDNFISKADKKFPKDAVVGQGAFYYYRSNAVPATATCATAQIKSGFQEGSSTIYTKKKPGGSTTTFKLHDYNQGIVYEDYQPNPKKHPKEIYYFKLIFLHYDAANGVLAYVRCSDHGTKKDYDAYSLVIKASNMKDKKKQAAAFKAADAIAKADRMDSKISDVSKSGCDEVPKAETEDEVFKVEEADVGGVEDDNDDDDVDDLIM